MNDRIKEIERKIERTISEEQMLPDGCGVVAGFSGGADSTVLVHFLSRYAENRGTSLLAAHVNHELRGEESDADEAFVTAWCEEHRVKLRVLHADVAALARKNTQGLEECGRHVRYTFFRSLIGETDRIATAHTLTDSSETVLMNLAKGAGLHGLSGIPPVRGAIIRPLIRLTRGEVEEYCRYYGLSFVTDSTNGSEEYARNRIRRTVLPVMKSINPEFEQAIYRATVLFRRDEEYFQKTAQKALEDSAAFNGGYSIEKLRSLPDSVLSRAVVRMIQRETSRRFGYGHIASVMEVIHSGKGNITLPGGIHCAASGNTLFILSKKKTQVSWKTPLSLPETVLPDGRVLYIRPAALESKFHQKNHEKINNLLFNNRINYDTILNTNSFVRNRLPGDSFKPAGRGVTKTLKKLLNEQKIPPFQRDHLVLLEGNGEILWIEGIGPSQSAAVLNHTQRPVEIIIKEC